MEVILSQFIRALAESGLMNSDEVRVFVDALPPDKKPKDGKTLAQELVRRGKLTKFQAQAVYQGKTKGLILGDYVVLDRIGQGGMGQVYKARHKVMKRVVALKTLPASATQSDRSIQRFHREVQVAARLSHPNIVTAHDARQDHGIHFLVMEHVEGNDLSALIKKQGRLPVGTAIDYILQAARGLEYAHSHNVIHRDIKPSNLVLDAEGTVKILDMGLARINEMVGSTDSIAEETLTGTGQAMGTIDYMPPEQAENTKTADHRADIYSLGCTLFSLLTARSIYSGDTTVAKLLAHREATIPNLLDQRPDAPENLEAVFQRMVAKKPEDRYSSMTEVIAALEQCDGSAPEQLLETSQWNGSQLAQAATATQPGFQQEDTPIEESLPLDFPVIAPVDGMLRSHRQPNTKQQVLIGSVIGLAFLALLLFAVYLSSGTPDGTLLVELDEAGTTVQVLGKNGDVAVERVGEVGKMPISVEAGKYRLNVSKPGFKPFDGEFTIASREQKEIWARLEPEAKITSATSNVASVPTAVAASNSVVDATTGGVRLLHTLEGHTDIVRSIAFTPDGSQLVSGSEDKTVRLWDTTTGKYLETLVEWPEIVRAIDISPNGAELVVAGMSRDPEIWDMKAKVMRKALKSPGGSGHAASFSPDGQYLAIGWVQQLRLYRGPDWELADVLEMPPPDPNSATSSTIVHIAFGSDSRHIAYVARNVFDSVKSSKYSKIGLWNLTDSQHDFELQATGCNVVAMSPDMTVLANDNGHNVELWDARSGQNIALLEQTGYVEALDFSGNGAILASGCNYIGGLVYLWRLHDRELVATLTAHTGRVKDVQFSPDGRLLASCSNDKTIKIWDVSALTQPQDADLHRQNDGSKVGLIRTLDEPTGGVCGVTFSPDGSSLVSRADYVVRFWDATTGRLKGTREDITTVRCLSFAPQGSVLTWGTSGDRIEFWDVAEGGVVNTIEGFTNIPVCVAFSPDGSMLASGCKDGRETQDTTIKLWDATTRQLRSTLEGHTQGVNSVAFSPDGSMLASGSEDKTIKLWNPQTDKLLTTLNVDESAYKGRVNCVQFSPDGSTLLSTYGPLRLWDVDKRELRLDIKEAEFCVAASFSPCGSIVASGNTKGYVQLWNAVTGELLETLKGHADAIQGAAFSPDGQTLATASRDGTVKLWDVSALTHPEDTPSASSSTQAPPLAIAPFTPEQAKQHQQAWADHLGMPVDFENSIGMKMVLIPPGEFMMGSSEEEIEAVLKEGEEQGWLKGHLGDRIKSEAPQHKVRISKPFYLAAHEVTVGHFREFVEATGYKTEAEQTERGGRTEIEIAGEWKYVNGREFNWMTPGFKQGDDHPVVQVSRNDARAFCQWLSETSGGLYRLPTEAQWEYACRAGSAGRWCCGDNESQLQEYAWYKRDGGNSSKPVGQKLPNAFGVFDMHGNVREWCSDWYAVDYYKSSPLDDPEGPSSGTNHVPRGGGYQQDAYSVRSGHRYENLPDWSTCNIGFRPVLVIEAGVRPKLTSESAADLAKP